VGDTKTQAVRKLPAVLSLRKSGKVEEVIGRVTRRYTGYDLKRCFI
jgi:hypothetical protein